MYRQRYERFRPDRLPGLKLWLRAKDVTATSVTAWLLANAGAGIKSVTEATNPPSLALAATAAGQPAISFDGSDDTLSGGDWADVNFERTDLFTIYIVFKRDAADRTEGLLQKQVASGAFEGWNVQLRNNAGSNRFRLTLDGGATSCVAGSTSGITSTTAFNIVTVVYRGTSLVSGVDLYLNNAKETVISLVDTLAATIQTSEPFLIGGESAGTGIFAGDYAEILIYRGYAHDGSTVNKVNRYLSREHNIAIS